MTYASTTCRALVSLRSWKILRKSERGAAAAEFALIVAIIVPALASVIDLGVYVFRQVQVELAAEAGVQAIRGSCLPIQVPVTRNCATGLLSTITTAVQSTSLGSTATVAAGSPAEGYYCVDASQQLQLVGASGSLAAPLPNVPSTLDCGAYGRSNTAPADYVQVRVNYTYAPLFPAASVAALLPGTITRTAWYRVR